MQPTEVIAAIGCVRLNVCMLQSKWCMMCVMLLSIALLGRFEMRVCALALSLVRRRALQVAAVSVAAVVARVSSCSKGKKGWRRA